MKEKSYKITLADEFKKIAEAYANGTIDRI